MTRTTDMTVGNPTKHILKFAFPLILTNIGQQLYMIADASIVGRGVGVKALAAVGATDWSYWLILWTITGLTQAFSTFVSRDFGDKNYKRMNKTIAMSVILCAVIGVLLTAIGLVAAAPLLKLLNTPSDIFDGAFTYLTTMICGTVIVMAYNMSGAILRAFGDGRSPLIAMIIAALLNIGLDLLFVFVLKLGIFGAALASVIAQFVSFIYCIIRLGKVQCVKLDREAWRLDFGLIKSLVFFGIPISLQYSVIAVGGIILQSAVNGQGSVFVAGYTATNKVYGLLESSAISLGLACSTFFAQNYGAGKYDRVKKGLFDGLKIVTVLALAVTGLTLIFRKYILLLFLDVSEAGGAEALEIGVHYLSIMCVFLIILYMLHIYRNALQALEISFWCMVSGVAEFVARVFMSKIAIMWIGRDSLFISEPAAWLGALLSVMIPYYVLRRKLLAPETERKKE